MLGDKKKKLTELISMLCTERRYDGIGESSSLVYFRLLHELCDAGPALALERRLRGILRQAFQKADSSGFEVLRDIRRWGEVCI
jgi:hypothetical protein